MKLADDLKNATSDADLKRAHLTAQTDLLKAQASDALAKADASGKYAKDGMVVYNKLGSAISQVSNLEKKIYAEPVLIPGTNKQGTLIDYIKATRKNGEVDGEAKKSYLGFGPVVPRVSEYEDRINKLKELLAQRSKLTKKQDSIDLFSDALDEPTDATQSAPVQFKTVQEYESAINNGTLVPKKGDKFIIGGKSATYQ